VQPLGHRAAGARGDRVMAAPASANPTCGGWPLAPAEVRYHTVPLVVVRQAASRDVTHRLLMPAKFSESAANLEVCARCLDEISLAADEASVSGSSTRSPPNQSNASPRVSRLSATLNCKSRLKTWRNSSLENGRWSAVTSSTTT
jgi:hypothetical protein